MRCDYQSEIEKNGGDADTNGNTEPDKIRKYEKGGQAHVEMDTAFQSRMVGNRRL